MYRKEWKTKKNNYCELCKNSVKGNRLAGPFSFFHIGSKFEKDKYKIVFVGKNCWYDKNDFKKMTKGKPFADATEKGRNSLLGDENKGSVYWKRIKAIIEEVYGSLDGGIENIAITNIIKCNTSAEEDTHRDTTPKEIRTRCAEKSRIFEKEIKILNPKHIIFFTGPRGSYDRYIESFNFGFKLNKNGRKTRKDNGKLIWWEREFVKNRGKIKVLRTSHPQGQHKKKFVNEIVDWIKKS